MPEQIIIRAETKNDYSEVFELNHAAFGKDAEAKLVDALRNNPQVFVPGLSIVAVGNHAILGHILFTKVGILDSSGALHESLGLAPMAVRPGFQKNGIGGMLVTKGLETAKELGFKSVIVLGHKHYYPKFGFQPAEKWHIKSPYNVPSEVFMAMELVNDGLKNISGMVVYPKEFDAL